MFEIQSYLRELGTKKLGDTPSHAVFQIRNEQDLQRLAVSSQTKTSDMARLCDESLSVGGEPRSSHVVRRY